MDLLGVLLGFAISLVTIFLPTTIAFTKKKLNTNAIFTLNLLLGWTIIGWIVALTWAIKEDRVDQVNIKFGFKHYSLPAIAIGITLFGSIIGLIGSTTDTKSNKTDIVQKQETDEEKIAKAIKLGDKYNFVKNNIIGLPEVTLYFTKLTDKEIDAIDVSFDCFNNYNEPVNVNFVNNTFTGTIQETIKKNHKTTWQLSLFSDNVTKIGNVKITKVHFTDGTTLNIKK